MQIFLNRVFGQINDSVFYLFGRKTNNFASKKKDGKHGRKNGKRRPSETRRLAEA